MNRDRHTPVVIGNYAPFRLVLRDTDVWNPTLEEINGNDYDYVKLSRLSGFLKIPFSPLPLAIGFDGSLILPALPKFSNRDNALAVFNQTLGTLLLGGIYCEAVNPIDISYGSIFFDGYLKQYGNSGGAIATFHQAIKGKGIGKFESIRLIEPPTISISEIETAYVKGQSYFEKIRNLSPELLLNGVSHFVKCQWTEALIFLWTSTEQVINIIWQNEIVSKSNDIENRKNFLNDSRTWTTSTKVEMLFQKSLFEATLYKEINSARTARNNFVHAGKAITYDKVVSSLSCLFKLISLLISDYKTEFELDSVVDIIQKNQRGELFPSKNKLEDGEVKYWMEIPALPGDSHWDGREYELIPEVRLQRLPDEIVKKYSPDK